MSVVVNALSVGLRAVSLVAPRLAGRYAFVLFCRPGGRARIRAGESPVQARAQTETVEVDGRQAVVYRWGVEGEPVLLVHGWEGRASRYAGLVDALLERGLSVIAFDAPGHGDAEGTSTNILEYETIIHYLHEQYGPLRAVVAHSFGVLGTFHALRTGATAERVVTINGVSDFEYLQGTFDQALRLPASVRRDLRRRTEEFFAPHTEIWQRFSVPYESRTIKSPILVVQDEDDDTVDPGQARQIVEAFPGRARLLSTHGLGHRRILSDPTVIEAVVAFVADDGPEHVGG